MSVKTCEICGDEFFAAGKEKYCCKSCARQAANIRKRHRASKSTGNNAKPSATGTNPLAENCADCIYRNHLGSNRFEYCDYASLMQKLRPCPPGDKCTAKQVGEPLYLTIEKAEYF